MDEQLTYEKVLYLIGQQTIQHRQLLEEQSKNFDNLLLKERQEREDSFNKEREERERSRRDFDKRLGELTGTWGKFVVEMVKPRIIDLFREKGIAIETAAQMIEGFKNGQRYYEIDLLLVNSHIAVVVEIKSSLSRADVDEHLARMQKIQEIKPKIINLEKTIMYGAVAGMIVENHADRYAYQKGLYVLRQKGNIVEIVNDVDFKAKEWRTDY